MFEVNVKKHDKGAGPTQVWGSDRDIHFWGGGCFLKLFHLFAPYCYGRNLVLGEWKNTLHPCQIY